MKRPDALLLRVLLAPSIAAAFSALDWDLLIRQARAANLLAELGRRLQAAGIQAPAPAQTHLGAAAQLVLRQHLMVRWELQHIASTVGSTTRQLTLLKGAAYLARGLTLAGGRLFTDIDLLVPRHDLDEVETAFLIHGWQSARLSAYDQRYYRQWMHEVPPLTHGRRGSSVDLHHAILPGTARLRVNTAALFEHLQALSQANLPLQKPASAMLHTLSDADMLLHSATHLFHEGEFDNGLRDLFDLDALMRSFGTGVDTAADFWSTLPQRATELGLQRPLFYALRYCASWLATPVPPEVLAAVADFGPSPPVLALMDACYARALLPQHVSCDGFGQRCARLALYLRSHWLRMPPHLLIQHLGRKVWYRLRGDPSTSLSGEAA